MGKHRITEHHRRPKSRGGTNDPRNISFVKENKHRAWHVLFDNLDIVDVVKILNETWIDPDFKLLITRR